jgi:hypothetical protein
MSDAAPLGPSLSPPRSDAAATADPFFLSASTDRPLDRRPVARTIGVRVTVKLSDKEASGSLCLHEIGIARRWYERQGGSVTVEPGWLPALPRHRKLTRDALVLEAERMRGTYRIVYKTRVDDFMAEFFGTEPAQQVVRLHALMRDQSRAWDDAVAVARELCRERRKHDRAFHDLHPLQQEAAVYDYISAQDIDTLLRIGQPDLEAIPDLPELSELTAPEAAKPSAPAANTKLEDIKLQAEEAADSSAEADPQLARIDRLIAAGLSQQQALDVTSAVEVAGDGVSLTDDELRKLLGSGAKGLVPAVRAAIIGG